MSRDCYNSAYMTALRPYLSGKAYEFALKIRRMPEHLTPAQKGDEL
jgi:hypothetical protein